MKNRTLIELKVYENKNFFHRLNVQYFSKPIGMMIIIYNQN